MPLTAEDKAREIIDSLLEKAGWHVCNLNDANIHAHRGIVIRNFPLKSGHGFADYLFYVDGKAAGVIEATAQFINYGVRRLIILIHP